MAMGKNKKRSVALMITISILSTILTIVICLILVIKLMPDSLGAYYIQDFIQAVQKKLGLVS